ncbi:hypothetical protein F4604DRAFT_1578153 [Suillus subluteus]|nr:hypothetical protein F4604DRAFT_1578153 [Suillus subluteus]
MTGPTIIHPTYRVRFFLAHPLLSSITLSHWCSVHANKQQKASLSCMDRNDYNRDKCMDFFQAYRDCKKAWLEQRREDRRAGRPTPI